MHTLRPLERPQELRTGARTPECRLMAAIDQSDKNGRGQHANPNQYRRDTTANHSHGKTDADENQRDNKENETKQSHAKYDVRAGIA